MSRTLRPLVVAVVCALGAGTAHAQGAIVATINGADKVELAKPGPWTQVYYAYVDGEGVLQAGESAVIVETLQDASGSRVECRKSVQPASGTFDSFRPLTITLSATFATAGTYTTTLRVRGVKSAASKLITVEIAEPATPAPRTSLVQVDKAAKHHEGDDPLRTARAVTVVMTLRNTSKQSVALGEHTVVLRRKTSAGHEVDLPASIDKLAIEGRTDLTVPAGATVRIDATLAGLDEPGHYTGVVRVVPIDKAEAPIDLDVEVFLRHPAWLCALAIILGATAAYLVRSYRDLWRKRAVLRIELAAVRERLDSFAAGAATAHAVALGRVLDLQARDLSDRIDRGDKGLDAEDAASPIKLLDDRVALFARYVAADAAIARLPADKRDALRASLDGVAAVIANPKADDTGIKKGGADLDELALRNVERTALLAWLATLEKDVASHRASGQPDLANAMDRELEPALDVARGLARRDEIPKLRAALEGAHRTLIIHGARALGEAMKTKPAGLDDATWATLTAEVSTALQRLAPQGDLETLTAAYDAVRIRYLIAVARGVAAVAATHALTTGLPPDQKDAVDAARALVFAACDRDPPSADELVRVTAALRELLRRGGVPIAGHGAEFRAESVDAPPGSPEAAFRTAGRTATAGRDWQALQKRLRQADARVFVVVTLIGVLAGLKLLWLGSATWGGLTDIVTAVVWGAGVNASADGFMGLLKLRDELGKV